MKKNIFLILLFLSFSSHTHSYNKNERIFGAIAGLATTVCLDSMYVKHTYPGWETWKLLWNTMNWNDDDSWFGPATTLVFETLPELGGHEKQYAISRFFTYYTSYVAAIEAYRYYQKRFNVLKENNA